MKDDLLSLVPLKLMLIIINNDFKSIFKVLIPICPTWTFFQSDLLMDKRGQRRFNLMNNDFHEYKWEAYFDLW